MSDVRVVALVSGHVKGIQSAPLQGPAPSVGGSGVLPGVRAVLAELSGPRAPGSVSGIETREEPVQAVSGFTVG